MVINTDSVATGVESLDLALSELKKAASKLTNGQSACPYNVPYQEVISQVNSLITMCTDQINACNNFNEQVALDDTSIDSLINPYEESSEEAPLETYPDGYDMVVIKGGSLLGEKGNSKTSIMSVKEGYLVKVIDGGDQDDPYALVMCYREDGKSAHIGYVDKDCLKETGGDSNLGFTVEETGGFARVMKQGVRVRETPDGNVLTKAPEGTYVRVLGFVPVPDYSNEQSWYVISYRNKDGQVQTGFMREDMLHWYDSEENMRQSYSQENNRAVVSGDKVNFRRAADTSDSENVICKLDKNVEVVILDETDEWYHVRYNGEEGYISKKYCKKQEPTSTPRDIKNYTFNEN